MLDAVLLLQKLIRLHTFMSSKTRDSLWFLRLYVADSC